MIRQEFFDKNIIYGVPVVWAWRFGVDKYSTGSEIIRSIRLVFHDQTGTFR